jgi:hypothetical protein
MYAALVTASEVKFEELAEEADAAKRAMLLRQLSEEVEGIANVYVQAFGRRAATRARGFREGAGLLLLVAEAEAARAQGRVRRPSAWTVIEQAGRLALDGLADPRRSDLGRRRMCDALRENVTPYLRGEGGGEVLETVGRGFARLAVRSGR